jgi:hypothetical protein
VNFSDDPVAQGNEKAVWRGVYQGTPLALKRPYKMVAKQSPNEVLRRFNAERSFMRGLEHSAVVAHHGGCLPKSASASSTREIVSVVEFAVPLKDVSDDYLASQPRRAVALYSQLLDLLEHLQHRAVNAPLFLCDFHRGQFGVAFDDTLRLLDVDSLRSHATAREGDAANAPRRLFDDVPCEESSECRQHVRAQKCMAVLRGKPFTDFACDKKRRRCRGLDERTLVAASRVVLERIRNAFDPLTFDCK